MSTSFLDSYQLHVSILSPVHIGTGQDYEPTSYVIEGNTLHAFDQVDAARALTGPEHRRLLEIVSDAQGGTMLKQVQALYQQNSARFIPVASQAIPVASGVTVLYAARAGKTAQREEDGREIINRLGIARTYTNPVDGRPVLLGSSLKGAVRTAMLNGVKTDQISR